MAWTTASSAKERASPGRNATGDCSDRSSQGVPGVRGCSVSFGQYRYSHDARLRSGCSFRHGLRGFRSGEGIECRHGPAVRCGSRSDSRHPSSPLETGREVSKNVLRLCVERGNRELTILVLGEQVRDRCGSISGGGRSDGSLPAALNQPFTVASAPKLVLKPLTTRSSLLECQKPASHNSTNRCHGHEECL